MLLLLGCIFVLRIVMVERKGRIGKG